MDIYTDYANWKFENYDFIHPLIAKRSKTISRFTSVIAVVDYLYEQFVKRQKLDEDEEVFFEVGFDYIHDNFYTIKTILDYQFNHNIDEMEKCAKTINLLLYVNEFQAELLNQPLDLKKELQQLDDFEQKINSYLDKKENVPDEYFPMFDDIINPIFEKNNLELNPIESIYYEAAVEYGIYKENETAVYSSIFNDEILKRIEKKN